MSDKTDGIIRKAIEAYAYHGNPETLDYSIKQIKSQLDELLAKQREACVNKYIAQAKLEHQHPKAIYNMSEIIRNAKLEGL